MISKLRAIGIPLLVFTLLMNVVLYIPLLINGNVLEIFSQYLGTLVFKMNMWFLLSLLLNMVAVAVITRVFKRIRAQYIGMCILFMISFFIPDGLILAVHKFMFPFSVSATFLTKIRFRFLPTHSVQFVWSFLPCFHWVLYGGLIKKLQFTQQASAF